MKPAARAGVLALVTGIAASPAAFAQGPSVAAWTWSRAFASVPIPVSAFLFGMTVMDAGDGPEIFVGGDFWGAPGYANWVARWNPMQGWRGLGPPYLYDWVEDLEVYDDGSGPALFAGGAFDDLNIRFLARWKPTTGWTRPPDQISGTGGCTLSGGYVTALAVHDDGSGPGLYVGGNFGAAACFSGNVASNKIIRYDSTGFHSLAGGVDDGVVTALCSFDDGTGPALYVGGTFTSIGGMPIPGIARWKSGAWSSVGSTQFSPGFTIAGPVVFDDGSGPALHCTLWSGSLAVFARWDGSVWQPIPSPFASTPLPFMAHDDGRGPGLFCRIGFGISTTIVRWDGQTWSGLGQGLSSSSGSTGQIFDMVSYDAGRGPELFVCGHFSLAGDGLPSRNIASWRGAFGPSDLICPGDRTFVPCPCTAGAPLHGCANSVDPAGALMTTSGSTANDTLVFTATGLPPSTAGLLFQGDAFVSNGAFSWLPFGLPQFGEGVRCAGGNLKRLYTKTASAGQITVPEPNDMTLRVRLRALGDALPVGAQRFYQIWYREPSPGFCTSTGDFNTTNGVRVVW